MKVHRQNAQLGNPCVSGDIKLIDVVGSDKLVLLVTQDPQFVDVGTQAQHGWPEHAGRTEKSADDSGNLFSILVFFSIQLG